jgi:hypothetical protein
MSTLALITWLFAVTIVSGFTGYFFYRILTNPQKLDVPTDEDAPHGTKTFDAT